METLKNNIFQPNETNIALTKTLEYIFKESPDGIVYKDENLRYKTFNKAFCQCFHIENPNDFINVNQPLFLNSENQKLVNEVNSSILKDKQAVTYIMSLHPNPEKILSVTSSPVIIESEFKGIISIVRDITQEECTKERFVSKHFQLKSLLENIPMIIYMQDKDLNYIVGTKPSKDFVEAGYDAFSNTYINQKKSSAEEDEENRYIIKNNKIIIKEKEVSDLKENKHWYKIYKVPIKDLNGEISGIITLANNIDAEKQLQAQRETFVASLGHDLKNPTIAQIRSLELLLRGCFGEINQNQKELLEMILDSCRYMNGMLSSLLATYRNYGGVVRLNFEEFSFSDLVNECVSEMIYVAKDKSVNICIDNKITCQNIRADRVQIKRVIMNLLSNGIKYAYSNTTLDLNLFNNKNTISFEFENESPYIPENKQKAIFAQYVTYASAHNELGIGLGLYASKKIIEGHSGNIFVKSNINNKNTFGFKIPISQKKKTKDTVIYF